MEYKIGERIKELRIEKNISQRTLSELCKVKQSCVSKWERGATLPPVDIIIILSRIFEISSDYLLGITDY